MKNFDADLKKFWSAEKKAFQKFSRKFYFITSVIFAMLAVITVIAPKSDTPPSWHEEIIPSNAIGYIDNGKVIALPDGDYRLAMPPQNTFVNGIAPMLLVEVDGNYFPLNIVDDSILPRRGKQLPLKILFGFTSAHAENTLTYKEKTGDDNPVTEYSRKAFYFLRVENGYGRVRRDFVIQTLN
ncbi:MAG: hypothetical protein K6G55_03925 [Selenomonadaceae bacterium]|nr:hypothetical protein [Selenomonadaceae bacterium]